MGNVQVSFTADKARKMGENTYDDLVMGDFTRVTEGLYSFDMNTHKPQVTSFSDQYYEIMQSDVGMEENNMLLRELLSAVKMGKTIEIDGRPVFEVVKRHNREEARANRFHMLMSD